MGSDVCGEWHMVTRVRSSRCFYCEAWALTIGTYWQVQTNLLLAMSSLWIPCRYKDRPEGAHRGLRAAGPDQCFAECGIVVHKNRWLRSPPSKFHLIRYLWLKRLSNLDSRWPIPHQKCILDTCMRNNALAMRSSVPLAHAMI